jgi:hypothetical protein
MDITVGMSRSSCNAMNSSGMPEMYRLTTISSLCSLDCTLDASYAVPNDDLS